MGKKRKGRLMTGVLRCTLLRYCCTSFLLLRLLSFKLVLIEILLVAFVYPRFAAKSAHMLSCGTTELQLSILTSFISAVARASCTGRGTLSNRSAHSSSNSLRVTLALKSMSSIKPSTCQLRKKRKCNISASLELKVCFQITVFSGL